MLHLEVDLVISRAGTGYGADGSDWDSAFSVELSCEIASPVKRAHHH